MRDFHQFRQSLVEKKERSKKGIRRHVEELWDANSVDFVKAGRNSTDISLKDPDIEKYIIKSSMKTRFPKLEWDRMMKDDYDLMEWIYQELYRHYE